MKKIILFSSACIFAAGFYSCKKAGTGGDAILAIFPKHHGTPIVNHVNYRDSAFIKFNTDELPDNPTTNYDLLVVGDVGEDHIHVEGLKRGKYYVYCTGWDTTINARVTGGLAVKIKYSERKDEIDLDVPVTE